MILIYEREVLLRGTESKKVERKRGKSLYAPQLPCLNFPLSLSSFFMLCGGGRPVYGRRLTQFRPSGGGGDTA
ncbi:hypothetical protein L2E82_16850 [Cichorium intybus]|uniref:Uncharacterized protein n=1 Tax=Cichorium intybus TaxID=13427 RepID=A0ACB9F604_CICIN|nr:hypothetical protein L2E82_16850 [Cichorium intybus]